MAHITVGIDPEIMRLTRAVVQQLSSRRLDEALQVVRDRMLRRAGDLVTLEKSQAMPMIRFRPYAELAFRDVISIARSTSDPATKTAFIKNTLSLAGY